MQGDFFFFLVGGCLDWSVISPHVGAFLYVTLIDFFFSLSHSPLFSSKIYVLFRQYMIPFSFLWLLCHLEDGTPACEKDMDQLNDQDRIPIEGLLCHVAIINWSGLNHLVLFLCSWAPILSPPGLQSTFVLEILHLYILHKACIAYLYLYLNIYLEYLGLLSGVLICLSLMYSVL